MDDKIVQGKIVGFGHAPYKDDEKNQPSYFVELETANGKNKFWGLGLKEPLEKNNINLGDTIALLDKGLIDGTKKREWEIEKYEPSQEHKNSIEHDIPVEKKIDKEDHKKDPVLDFKKDHLKDELDFPDSIKNNYTAIVRNRLFKDEAINFYDRDDKNNTSIAFEDRKSSLNTSRSDEKTVSAMLDIAESKSWSSISLKGTEEFKQKAWLEASIRGIEIKGYVPSEKDLAELKMAQQERTNNKIQHEATTLKKDIEPQQKVEVPLSAEQINDARLKEINNPTRSIDEYSKLVVDEIKQKHENLDITKLDTMVLGGYIHDAMKELDSKGIYATHGLKNVYDSIKEHEINKEISVDAHKDKSLENNNDLDKSSLSLNQTEKTEPELKVDANNIRDYLDYADKLIDQASMGQSKITTNQGEILQSDRLKLIEPEFRSLVQESGMTDYIKQNYIEEMSHKIKNLDELVNAVENKKINGLYDESYKIHFDKYQDAYDNSKAINAVESSWNEKLGIAAIDKELTYDKLKVSELSTTNEVRNYIGQFLASELEKGNINNRDNVIDALKKEGFNVLREETKFISIENPIGNRNIRLQGEMFDKGFNAQDLEKEKLVSLITSYKDEVNLDAVHTGSINKNTGLENLRIALDTYKDKLEDKDKIGIDGFKQVIEYKFKDNPDHINKRLNDLANKIPEIANGTYELPDPPELKKEAEINIQVTKQNDKDRSR